MKSRSLDSAIDYDRREGESAKSIVLVWSEQMVSVVRAISF